MQQELIQYFANFDLNEGAKDVNIQSINGVTIPDDYISFMKEHNGGNGEIGEYAYLELYPLEEIEEMNQDYCVEEFLPGNAIFGTNAGGEFYGFDKEGNYFAVPDVPMCESEKIIIGKTWLEFIAGLDTYLDE